MKTNYIILLMATFFCIFQSCKKDDNDENPTTNKITLNFSSDSILYQGQFYHQSITVDTNALVSIVKKGKIYFYYAGLGTSFQDKLNDTLSAISLIHRIKYYYSTNYQSNKKSLNTNSIAGVEIDNIGSQKYQFDNTKRRMVGLKFSSSNQTDKVLLPPKGPLLDHNLITLMTDPNSADLFFDKSTYERSISSKTNCDAFGSIFSIILSPLALVQFQSILDGYNADKDYFIHVTFVDGFLVSIDIIEELIGQFPFCGDLIGYSVFEPIRLAFIAAIDNSSDPLVFQTATMDMIYNILKSTVECACTGSTSGLCAILEELKNIIGLIPFIVDQGIRSWDVITTPAYGIIVLGDDGLIAYYPFNGNANDESGNGNNGTINGATLTTDRFGSDNRAYSFNGSSDYISLFDNNGLQFGTDDVTVCAWIKTSQVTGGRILCRGECNGSAGWQLTFDNSTNSMLVGLQHGGGATYFRGNKTINDNSWHFLCWYRKNNNIQMFIDGQPNGTSGLFTTSLTNLNSNLKIGIGDSPCNYPFKGSIDDIRIFNRAISESEIEQLYHEGGWLK